VNRYEKIMGLVEEVRDIMDLNEIKIKKLSKDEKREIKNLKRTKGFKGAKKHNPFRWVKKGKAIGLGPGLLVGPRKMKKRGMWKCTCAGYKCKCIGGPDGNELKKVKIDKSYKAAYNKKYAAHRKKHASNYLPGKDATFKRRPKK
jgi:hypothetical protein